MTDAELNDVAAWAQSLVAGGEETVPGPSLGHAALAVVAEVRRLEATVAQHVEMAAHAIARTRIAKRLADAVVDRALLMDQWGAHVAHCQVCLTECPEDLRFDAEEAALDARIEEATLGHRKAMGL